MKWMSFCLVLNLMFQASAEELAAPKANRLTLEESLRIAIHGASSVLKTESDNQLSGTQLLQSYLQFLPSVTAVGNYNYAKGTTYFTQATPVTVHGSTYGPSYQLSATLNIFNGFSDVASFKSALDKKDAAEKTLVRAKQQISLDIAQAFLQVILDQKLIEIAEKNLKVSRERERLLDEQTKVGVRNLSDLFRQQAQTSADESFTITVQNKKKTDLILLLRKLRIDPKEEYELIEPPLEAQVEKIKEQLPSLENVNVLIEKALDARQDYRAAKQTAESTKWDVTSARSQFLPRLDFVGTYGALARHLQFQNVSGVGDVTPANQMGFNEQLGSQTVYTYGVVLTWNIFDRWVTGTNVEKAKVQAFKAGVDQFDSHNQVVGEVKQAVNDLQAAVQQLISSEKGVIAARKAYEVSQGRYEVGSLNFIDLSTTQTALVQAEASRAQALIGFELQKRTIDFAVGTTSIEE